MLVDQISFFSLVVIFIFVSVYTRIKKWINESRLINNNPQSIQSLAVPNDKYKLLKTIISSYAAFNSVITCIGFLTETYLYGARLLLNILSITIGYIIAFLLLHPLVYNLDKSIKTPYEYLSQRYNNKLTIRIISALDGILFYILFMALHLWGCSIILSTILPQIPNFYISSAIVGVVATIGSFFEGFNQSLKINLVQLTLLLSGLTAALVSTFSSNKNNKSASELWNLAEQFGRTNFVETSGDIRTRYTIWNQVFSLPIPWVTVHLLMQPSFTKNRSILGKKRSRFILLSHIPIAWLINSLFVFCGIGIFCFYYDNDPISGQRVKNRNQIAPLWIIESLDLYLPSFAGLCLASLFTSSLQVYSIGIWSGTNSVLDTFLYKLPKERKKFYQKVCCIFFGALTVGFSFLFQFAKNSILSLFFVFSNSLNSPILGLFLVSALNPFANWVGVFLAFSLNIGINVWLALGALAFSTLKNQEFSPLFYEKNSTLLTTSNSTVANNFYPTDTVLFYLYSISSIWYCLFSLLFNLIIGSFLSCLYSLIMSKSFDIDNGFKEKRKNYLVKFQDLLIYK